MAPPSSAGIIHEEPTVNAASSSDIKDVAFASEEAIDDSADADSDYVTIQKNICFQHRRLSKEAATESHVQKRLGFHYSPIFRPLNETDVESCAELENEAFEQPCHRCTPDKFKYRLAMCPELTMGIFFTVPKDRIASLSADLGTVRVAKPVETSRHDRDVSVLIAHIVSTKALGPIVTDCDMDYPRDWEANPRDCEVGHREAGRTICLHSLAVAPKLKGCGLGKQIMRYYLQYVKQAQLADRVSLLCQDYLINYYQSFGFQNLGESKAQFGGGGWYNMVFDIGSPISYPSTVTSPI